MNKNDLIAQLRRQTVPGNTPPETFDRSVHVALNLYAMAVAAYIYYSLFTLSGVMRFWLKWIEAGWIPVRNNWGGLIVFLAPALGLILPVFVIAFAARKSAPRLARAIDSWGVRPPARRNEIQSWKSIFKITAGVALFFNLIAPLIFWSTQSPQARKIHEIDLNDGAAVPAGAKFVRLTGVIVRRFWLASGHESGSGPVNIAPVVSEHWRSGDAVRYFAVADGDKPSSFQEEGGIHLLGEAVISPSDMERQALERYRSMGLKIDPAYVIIQSKDLPGGGYAPIDYDALYGPAALGGFIALVIFVGMVVSRYQDKHKIGQTVIQLR